MNCELCIYCYRYQEFAFSEVYSLKCEFTNGYIPDNICEKFEHYQDFYTHKDLINAIPERILNNG